MDRKLQAEIARAKREQYLFAHTDSETANYFIDSWNSDVSERKVCENVDTSFDKVRCKNIFTNQSGNKLTEYGNIVALNFLLNIPAVERTCKFAKYDYEELFAELSKGFVSEEQKQNFIEKRSYWFNHLRDRMRELRISKETFKTFGVNYKTLKSFAYQTI